MKALTRLPDNDGRRLDLLRALWLQRLPPAVRAGITNFMKLPEDAILELADSLQGSTLSSDDSHACSAQDHDEHSDDENISAVPYSQHRRKKSPANKRDASSTKKTASKDICYYHARFGKEARNCKPPCIF